MTWPASSPTTQMALSQFLQECRSRQQRGPKGEHLPNATSSFREYTAEIGIVLPLLDAHNLWTLFSSQNYSSNLQTTLCTVTDRQGQLRELRNPSHARPKGSDKTNPGFGDGLYVPRMTYHLKNHISSVQ